MNIFYRWLLRPVPLKLKPAKGMMNGLVLGIIGWAVIIAVVAVWWMWGADLLLKALE